MSKDPFSGYSNTGGEQGTKRASCGGDMTGYVKPLPYKPPVGPKNQMSPGPGLRGGTNHGCCGTQGKH